MSKIILQQSLRFSRSTKSTHRFDADDSGAKVRSLYVEKAAFPQPDPPAFITIILEDDAD